MDYRVIWPNYDEPEEEWCNENDECNGCGASAGYCYCGDQEEPNQIFMENTELSFEKFETTFKVGDRVTGLWRMNLPYHETYRTTGVIIHNPASGFWVESESESSPGITAINLFTELEHY